MPVLRVYHLKDNVHIQSIICLGETEHGKPERLGDLCVAHISSLEAYMFSCNQSLSMNEYNTHQAVSGSLFSFCRERISHAEKKVNFPR